MASVDVSKNTSYNSLSIMRMPIFILPGSRIIMFISVIWRLNAKGIVIRNPIIRVNKLNKIPKKMAKNNFQKKEIFFILS